MAWAIIYHHRRGLHNKRSKISLCHEYFMFCKFRIGKDQKGSDRTQDNIPFSNSIFFFSFSKNTYCRVITFVVPLFESSKRLPPFSVFNVGEICLDLQESFGVGLVSFFKEGCYISWNQWNGICLYPLSVANSRSLHCLITLFTRFCF